VDYTLNRPDTRNEIMRPDPLREVKRVKGGRGGISRFGMSWKGVSFDRQIPV